MIELKDYDEPYVKVMKPLKYVETKQNETNKEKNEKKS